MKMNVLAFVPYEAMRTTVRDAQKNYPDLSIDIVVGTYDDYLEKSDSIDLCQYSCVFARGYTAQMLKKISIIPVSEIKVSLYDMLRVITMARLRNVPFAILASSNILETAHQIIDILQYHDIFTYDIESEEDAERRLAELTKQGIHLIVGDVYAVNAAQKVNIPSILITSSRTSIDDTIQDAINNRKQHLQIYEKLDLISEVMRNDVSSIVVFDRDQEIVLSNLTGLQVTYRQLEKQLCKMLNNLVTSKEPVYCASRIDGTVLRINGHILNLDTPYYAFYIQAAPTPHPASSSGIRVVYPSEENHLNITDRIFEIPQKYLNAGSAKLSLNSPTVIIGGIGSGKELLANYLWCTGPFQDVPLITIDCTALNRSALEACISNPDSPLYDKQIVLLIKNLHFLSIECQQLLCQFLEDSSFSAQNPLIVTLTESPNTLFTQHKLLFRLCDYLIGTHLYIENLNQQPEEIASLADKLINKYNMEFGQEVIGLMPDALKALQNFHWNSNINQLKSVIRQLVSTSSQHYISPEQVKAILDTMPPSCSLPQGFDMTGTMEEIEERIILSVLQDENMNYTSAAKRLGISRSTLYRKLKNGRNLLSLK